VAGRLQSGGGRGGEGAPANSWISCTVTVILFAVAGNWRGRPEWGAAYSMVMTEACEHVAGVHDRMPAILPRSDWADWLDGPPDAAGLLCRPYGLGNAGGADSGGLGAAVIVSSGACVLVRSFGISGVHPIDHVH
jgi:hypothetical protein